MLQVGSSKSTSKKMKRVTGWESVIENCIPAYRLYSGFKKKNQNLTIRK